MKPRSAVLKIPYNVIPPVTCKILSEPYLTRRFGARRVNTDLLSILHAALTREILEEIVKELPFTYSCDVGPEEWRVTYFPGIPEEQLESVMFKRIVRNPEEYYAEFVRRFYERAVDAGVVEI